MPDLKKVFSVGEKIQILFNDGIGKSHEYVSQIINFHDNEHIDVLIPIYKSEFVYLKEDTIFKVVIPKGEAVYEFVARIADKLYGKIPMLRLHIISELTKIQRRNYYRLKLIREVEIRVVLDLKDRKFGEKLKGHLLDISGGGLMFNMSGELDNKDLVEITLDLNGKKMVVFGSIVRKSMNHNARTPYTYGVSFEKITEFERNVITKFIFEEQRKLIKKGLV
ncbi:MAG: flagellar brake protein [Caulobacteraceae bacterium]